MLDEGHLRKKLTVESRGCDDSFFCQHPGQSLKKSLPDVKVKFIQGEMTIAPNSFFKILIVVK